MLTRDDCRDLRSALEKVSVDGWTFTIGNMRYADAIEVKLTCAKNGKAGETVDPAEVQFKRYCYKYGMKAEHFGMPFNARGKSYTICGIRYKARTSPILARDNDTGKVFIFNHRDVLLLLSRP